jgi:hypothetical protein
MNEQNQNLAVTNKWVCDIPLSTVIPDIEDVSLNLVTFSIPAIEMSKAEFSYMGNAVEIPTGVVNPSDKTITFNYLIGSDWSQYRNLYKWVSALGTVNTPMTEASPTDVSNYKKYSLPIRVYILDEFKKTVLSFKYSNSWINMFSEVSMDYSDDPTTINHSFTISYSDFIME